MFDGRYELERFPATKNSTLRAWDAADEYAIEYLSQELGSAAHDSARHVVVVNDGFGALVVALAAWSPMSLTDSVSAREAAERNVALNATGERAGGGPTFVTPLDDLAGSLHSPQGYPIAVVIKVPKTLSLLEHELNQVRPIIGPDTMVLGAGMVKQIHTSTLAIFERVIGTTTTSLAKRKARLIHAVPDQELAPAPVEPVIVRTDSGSTLVNLANVFARDQLDVGTRFLLEHLPTVAADSDVVDLGCGNGAVGIELARTFTGGSIRFTDVSHLAVASARASHQATFGDDPVEHGRAVFEARHVLDGVDTASADLVVNNPPFHDQHVLGDETAWRMFVESRRVLRPGGELRVVGNRHLGYHTKLKRLFGNCRTVGSNNKFVVLSATR